MPGQRLAVVKASAGDGSVWSDDDEVDTLRLGRSGYGHSDGHSAVRGRQSRPEPVILDLIIG